MNEPTQAATSDLEQALKLPRTAELVIPEDYLDSNGHVNMMYFTLIGNLGWRDFFNELGLHREKLVAAQRSTFALRQFISYFSELKEGDKVAVHSGLVNYDSKRLHFVFYIVNLSTNKLAASDERLVMYMDMVARRSATFEPEVMAQLEKVKAKYAALNWKPELSGAIKVKNKV